MINSHSHLKIMKTPNHPIFYFPSSTIKKLDKMIIVNKCKLKIVQENS